jgi:putative DNA methylase
LKPIVSRQEKTPAISFIVEDHQDERFPNGTMSRKGAMCPCCQSPVSLEYLRSEGKLKRIGIQLIAIAAEGKNGRIYLEPNSEHEKLAKQTSPKWMPETELSVHPQYMGTPRYGLTKHCDLFTTRQLTFLSEVTSLMSEVKDKITADYSINTSQQKFNLNIQSYVNSVLTYLGFCLSNLLDDDVTLCTWRATHGTGATGHAFARQAISMTWDFPEANPFANAAGDLARSVEAVAKCIEAFPNSFLIGKINQIDAANDSFSIQRLSVISTDPPYYDAVPYADLSDFFYVWLRHALKDVYPDIFKTVLVPKSQELVADQFRLGGSDKAKTFFEEGLRKVFSKIRDSSEPNYPFTVYYAFKQTESDIDVDLDIQNQQDSFASTGWETMLEGLMNSGFSIVGTWPVRTERSARSRSIGFNALASSIVLVCRPRPDDAPSTTRRRFVDELKSELPDALKKLQQGNIAPVDLAQASIGPGMAIFSRYAKVVESDGSPMRVRTALQLINQTLDEFLAEQEGEFDTDTRWALAWFEQYQFNEGQFGDAETLSKAKNTSIKGMAEARILTAKAGKVQLIPRDALPPDWNPAKDSRIPVWEATQHLIRALDQKGEMGAAHLSSQLGDLGEVARDLAYRLYSICDRKGWTQEAIAYNSLVISWPEISRLALEEKPSHSQLELF